MKKKIYLVGLSVLLLISFATFKVYNKTIVNTKNSEETTLKQQAVNKKTLEQSKEKISEKNREDFSVDFKKADAETIYNTFNDSNADSIINSLEISNDDSDRILVSPDGTILSGQAIIDEDGTEVDSNTDKNSITVKELKDFVLLHKPQIDELAAQNSPLE